MSNCFFLAQANPQAGGSQLGFMFFLIIMLVVYWVFLIRPQSKKRKELQQKLSNLKKGDRVVTIGGVHGKIVSVKDKVVVLRVDDRAEITFDKVLMAGEGDAVKVNEQVLKYLWIPILISILCIGALVYVNVVYKKQLLGPKKKAARKKTSTARKSSQRRTRR